MQVTDQLSSSGCVKLQLNVNTLQSADCKTELPYLCMKKPTVKTTTARTTTITTQAPKVWFGQGDLFLCHCEAPHCGAGACQGDTAPCEQNWFGLRCQYRNLAGAAYVLESSLPSLTDNNDSTCHQDTERSVTVKFREEQVITWIRIVVKDKIDHYTVQAFSGLTPRACTHMSVLQPTPTTLDLACNLGTVYVTKVTVSWRVHHVICSLYISGGRNLALKSRVSHSPAANTTPSDAAVDGQMTQPCLVLNDTVTHQQLQLVFSTPKLITEIVIHTSTANTSYGTLNGFRLEVVGEGEVSLQNLTGVRADVTGRLRFKSIVRRPAMRVDVNLVTQPGHPMEVCELEVFGDCSSPVYGLYCDEICSMGCVDQLCHYNGQCYHCVEGRTGKHCVGGNSNASFDFDDSRNVTSPPTHEPKESWIFFGFDLVVFLLYLGAVVCFLLCFIVFCCCRRKAQQIEKVHRRSIVSDNFEHQIPMFVSQIGPVESTNSLISRTSLEESIIVDDFQHSVVSAATTRYTGTTWESGASRLSRDTEV
ncbi:uncharacterized protein LOC131943480 [Physella acuta]|uniref:uncharacterized protein LOC131943480 n=1 Tax=Physella acuta TaxID=109671 RepID=UPI0027DB29A5|nr:uncharacterized protein LOC131943480 [Physella acuta]XP_059159624.1 uncharacterized protein LOC131943480 [Physella acuta]